MSFDDIFGYVGGMGGYQVALYLLLGLPSFFGGYQSMSVTFLGPDQDHWCKIQRLQNYSHAQQKYVAIPYDAEEEVYEQCSYYDLNYTHISEDEIQNWNWTEKNVEDYPIVKCDSWVFDQSEYVRTALSEYNLVCDDTYRISLVYSSYMMATVTAGLIAGPLSDKFGRGTILTIASFFQGILGLIAAFAPGYMSFLLLRFLMAVSITFASTCCFVLAMEVFGPQYRAIAGGLYWLFWAAGFTVLPGISYFIRDFRKLQITLAMPMLTTWCYLYLVSESPRWLYSKARYQKTEKVLTFIAQVNKGSAPDDMLKIIHDDKNDEHNTTMDTEKVQPAETSANITAVDLLRSPVLRKHLLAIMPGWVSCTLIYYGMSFNTGSLAGSVYINTFMSGLVEFPAYLGSLPCMYKLGRRYTQFGSLIFSGCACFVCIPFMENEDLTWLVTTLMLIGKAAITLSFATIFVYTAELFPTPVRHIAIGFNYMLGNLLGLVAPFMGPPLLSIWTPLPLVIFGVLGTISGLLILLLPETLNKKLPDNIEEVLQLSVKEDKSTSDDINLEKNNLSEVGEDVKKNSTFENGIKDSGIVNNTKL